jgi:hypothetical protein
MIISSCLFFMRLVFNLSDFGVINWGHYIDFLKGIFWGGRGKLFSCFSKSSYEAVQKSIYRIELVSYQFFAAIRCYETRSV